MPKKVLIIIVLVLGLAAFYAVHNSNQEAANQAKAIAAADLAGQDVGPQLSTLKAYVAAHMGTAANITLSGAFQRAQAAARAAAQAQGANSQIYAQAQAACAGKSDSITQAKCNQDFLASHLANVPPPTSIPEPKISDYQYKFRAPLWTADLAGGLVLATIAALIMLVIDWVKNRP